ncbi:AF4 FMR2 family member 4-like protein [Labeo rohita]|uniref:AF4 FMR2 family member 4-like protein n=1 Tax=Labeo rohita TaxID=84645 RepID=A0A498LR01_LABRO|nr:AF4 FMR2 family member 4-like protein [Labeo rohita]
MSDRKTTPHSGQYKPRMSGGSRSVYKIGLIQYDEHFFICDFFYSEHVQRDGVREADVSVVLTEAPAEPLTLDRIKDDELSSRIQRMLGNYEDGYEGPEEACPALPHDRSLQFPHVDGSKASLREQSGRTDRSKPVPDRVSVTGPPLGESWDSLPALSPPVEPLSPLQSSDSDGGPSPERSSSSRRPDAPPPTLTLPLNLHGKLANAKKPTAYVRPMDGPVASDSPELKASPESYEHLQDLKDSGKPNLAALQAADIVSGERVEDILQPQKESDWQLGRWLERRGNQHQQNPRSPCDVIRPNSHDSSERTEAAGTQSYYSNPTDGGKASDHRSTNTCENPLLEGTGVEISQHAEKASTHRPKHKRKKAAHHTQQKRTTADNNVKKQTDRKETHQPLLVKIELNLLSRIPREPGSAPSHAGNISASGHKRPVERDEKCSRKKQKLDKEGKQSSSSQKSLHQSEADMNGDRTMKKKSTKHGSSLPREAHRDSGRKRHSAAAPAGQQKKAETHGKKTCKSHGELPEKPAAKPRALLPPDRRKLSVEDHLKEAKKLKHKADATPDKMAKVLSYLEAALSFVESAVAMETEPQTPKSAYTMFSETVDLIRFILKLKSYTDPSAAAHERDFCVLCMRCQSLLQMALFRYRRDSALKYSRTLTDHFKSSSWSASPSVSKSAVPSPSGSTLVIPQPIQQVAASYVSITALFLSAHETWEQADEIALRGSGLLQELDSAVGPLSLTSSMSALVRYARHGLHWIRLDALNPR